MTMSHALLTKRWLQAIQQDKYVERHSTSMFFQGRIIYSYGTHYPIARVFDGPWAAFNSKSSSKSTSRHRSIVRQALHAAHIPLVEVPYVDCNYHDRNLKYLLEKIREAMDKAIRARTSVGAWIECWERHKDAVRKYCAQWELPLPERLSPLYLEERFMVKFVTYQLHGVAA